MKPWTIRRAAILLAVGLLVWVAVAAGCLAIGSTGISWPRGETMRFRREAVLVASLVGAALALSGTVYQAILRNPLAEPYLLGVSSGASLAVYAWAMPAAWIPLAQTLGEQGAAFAGALASLGIVFGLAQRRGRLEPVTLLLVGVIVNAINGAIFLLLFHLSSIGRSQDIGRALRFMAGGLQNDLQPVQVAAVAACCGVGLGVALYLSGQLNIGMLGEAEAESLGVRVQRLRWAGLAVASLVTASAVAISGPIGFLGLICPHIGRRLVGNDQRKLVPVATVLGACLLALADAGSRRLDQLPVGVLTGFLGGPFFLLLLWRQRHAEVRR